LFHLSTRISFWFYFVWFFVEHLNGKLYIHNSGWLQWFDIPDKHYLKCQRFEFWSNHSPFTTLGRI
jgi:hypothetical protein